MTEEGHTGGLGSGAAALNESDAEVTESICAALLIGSSVFTAAIHGVASFPELHFLEIYEG